jgi:aldose 1-epimerase
VTKTLFGQLDDGTPIHEVTLRAPSGAQACVVEWGAVLRDLQVPCRGGLQRTVLGFPRFADYPAHSPHMGAIAGRYANRIGGGRFTLDGQDYSLPLNQDGRHSAHGGGKGFGKRPWTIVHHDEASVTLALVSPAGDAGYPGTLDVTCRYRLVGEATLQVALQATTDAPTVVNLCNHPYFNLDGADDILAHELLVAADVMIPVDADLIPDGAVARVAGTPFDFRTPRPIRCDGPDGDRVRYDHAFFLRRTRLEPVAHDGLALAHAATLRSAANGLAMEIWTTEPALQVYDGAKLNTPVPGHDGRTYGACAGIALEAQHAPNAPNIAHFPTTVLRPGAIYRQVTEYRFGGPA